LQRQIYITCPLKKNENDFHYYEAHFRCPSNIFISYLLWDFPLQPPPCAWSTEELSPTCGRPSLLYPLGHMILRSATEAAESDTRKPARGWCGIRVKSFKRRYVSRKLVFLGQIDHAYKTFKIKLFM
jgi:hypothetical protein